MKTKLERMKAIRAKLRSDRAVFDLDIFVLQNGPIICLNPHSITVALSDDLFFSSIINSNAVVVDGIGLHLVSKYLWRQKSSRITGTMITDFILKKNYNKRVACVGSSQDVLVKLTSVIEARYRVTATSYSPPFVNEFSSDDIAVVKEFLKHENPDLVLLGLTAPKQEKLADSIALDIHRPILCVGAVFDYLGNDSLPPMWIRRCALEWLYRLLSNPRKMLPRLFTGIQFMFIAVLILIPSNVIHLKRGHRDKRE
ncbi:WecB/TagA/CpsF family glycosyltransferase [Gammaproteobacteria bacterium]|nr:WecB/TagA/CpsF family glycosyltransferase [Gammaproteobacteria bacterium]